VPVLLMIKKGFLYISLLVSSCVGFSQQMPIFSQYMMNGFSINPAMSGYDGLTTINFLTRRQWLGLQNAPQTFSLSAQTRILKRSYIIKARPKKSNIFIPARKGNVGLGFNVISDRNGNFEKNMINLSYAYHIGFPNSQLSFGVAGSINQFKISSSDLWFRNNLDEPSINQGIFEPIYVPDVSTGVYYMTHDFYGGFSVSNLFQSVIQFGSSAKEFRLKREYDLLAGYRFMPRLDLALEPSLLLKSTEQLFSTIDLSLKCIYRDDYWAGLSYRTASSLILFMGVKYNRYYLGYAFDYIFNSIQSTTFGSHELLLAAKFGDTAKRYRWKARY
jgi:type IX secretion system PorP/SprF family membrane protein